MQIDFASINPDEFSVSPRGEFVLVTPRKSKHVWLEEELHLRSLLCRLDGSVVSAGWPKFRNYGEDALTDAEFRAALTRNAVKFTEKMDGSLIILSYVDRMPHLRTRGNHNLGDFEFEVRDLIDRSYPDLLPWYTTDKFVGDILRRHFSVLFEYVSPLNRIVLKYDKPELYLLGLVELDDLSPSNDNLTLHTISRFTGVPIAPVHALPNDMEKIGPVVRAWQDKEGVVAQFPGTLDGIAIKKRLIKIKATQYLKLHTVKFRLEGKVRKLACLLGIRSEADVIPKLSEAGIDYEASQFIMPEMNLYLAQLQAVTAMWDRFRDNVRLLIPDEARGSPTSNPHLRRKWFVDCIKTYIAENDLPEEFFGPAMKLYDGKDADASLAVYANLVMGESVGMVRGWMNNPTGALSDMLAVVPDED